MKSYFTFASPPGLAIVAVLSLSACSEKNQLTPENLFNKKCGTCHSVEPNVHKIGPSLNGVLGRKAGSTDFKKYKALRGADFVWDMKKLDAWITNPKKFINKPTAMTVKVKKETERKMILGFITNVKK